MTVRRRRPLDPAAAADGQPVARDLYDYVRM
ncbi:hypothetical protein HMPREF9336_04279 [Segniliparus rugosus ATCC BAA-974]|uniref:Uncharacterized protein n=1 Tax=Segniliparus rugosus (strain ATCC BAA-974 / DSM 45345 / CCUG 50838 / CIP 108380 / JCM 13579 / CDC 945) TaxID=679197 RepID=U1M224_SEGRC|nr:hypothetical protein HMPREF9336_04279 [Segniliparus rugosus ATCC BAA-974]